MVRVLCTALSSEHGPHFEILKSAGHECHVPNRSRNLWNAEELKSVIAGYHAIIAGSEPYTADVINTAKDLRAIVRAGVGFDAINLPACDDRKIVVATTPGVNHHAVAEHAIAMLMAIGVGFPALDQEVRRCEWKRVSYPRISSSTLGLLGLGRIGQATAARALGLGMKVVAYDPFPPAAFLDQFPSIRMLELDDLLSQSDFVSLHLPMSPATKHLINDSSIAKMKRGAMLINTARGPLIDEAALVRALESGQIRAAGLDVFEVEPLPASSPLLKMSNVLLAPHIAGLDDESHIDTWALAANIILRLLRGEWPAECIQNLRGVNGWAW
jgi:phosphoglycerate dehydrogenase-like enzyme